MVKNRKEDRMLRELFREKLKNSEVIPSEEGGRVLFRRLTRKEFFHFIPSKFNIWYAGGLAALAATIVLAVMSLSDREVIGEPAAFSPDIEKTETIISNIEAETPVITGGKTEESYKEQSEETYRYIFEKWMILQRIIRNITIVMAMWPVGKLSCPALYLQRQ
jgi:hypothetical protein